MADNGYKIISDGIGKRQIFAGPQTESVVAQEITIAADEASTGETKKVLRGTALKLDGTECKVLTATGGPEGAADDSVYAIAACDISTDGADVVTSGYLKGGFGDTLIDFGGSTLADVEANARQNGIFFHPVYK